MSFLDRRGNANTVVQWIVAIGIGVVVIVAIAIMLGALRDDTVTNTAGCNSTATSGCGYDYNVTTRGLTFLDNATSKFGTAGTLIGVGLILAVVTGGAMFGYSAYKKRGM